jgi:hypothetical protein
MHNGKVWTRTLGPPFFKKKRQTTRRPLWKTKCCLLAQIHHHCDGRKIKPIGFFYPKKLVPNAFQPQKHLTNIIRTLKNQPINPLNPKNDLNH